MINFKPQSSLGLLLLGFFIVTLPLVAGHGRALLFVDQISERSDDIVARGVELVTESSALSEDLTGLQRYARQYQIIGEPDLVNRFTSDSAKVVTRLKFIRSMLPDTDNTDVVDVLESRIIGASAALAGKDAASPDVQRVIDDLARLSELTPKLEYDANAYVRRELKGLDDATGVARKRLLLQASALIPATIILVFVFSFLVERPMRQMGRAIRGLGEGRMNDPIAVRGPRELEHLGRELDWLRARLVESEEEKNHFLRRVSHELKTPLASIREGAELLADESVGKLGDAQLEVATLVRASSVDLQRQIENLLNFNLRDALDAAVNVTDFSLPDLIEELRNRHQLTLTSNALMLDFDDRVAECRADREKLRITLDNLLTNAVRYSPQGGTISITSRQNRGTTTIEVRDEGPGVPKDEQAFVFRPFYQGSTSSGKHVRGTGIGLSVARESVTVQGGTLELLNSRRGARFRITLPEQQLGSEPTTTLSSLEENPCNDSDASISQPSSQASAVSA